MPRRGGTTSIALKGFLLVGTLGLFVWAGFLPDNDDEPPLGWVLLFGALLIATLGVLVLRVLGRSRPLIVPIIRVLIAVHRGPDGGGAALNPSVRALLHFVGGVLAVVWFTGWVAFVVAMIVVVVVAIGWNATIPVALGVTPLCVALAAQFGLWLIGYGGSPGGD